MNCPRCGVALQVRRYEADVDVDECPSCKGMWLDAGELRRVQEVIENDYSRQLRRPEEMVQRSYEMARQQQRPDVPCPKCGRMMFKQECQPSSGILVEMCPGGEGMWFDQGEVEALEVFSERMRAEERREAQRGFLASLRTIFRN